ncbi:glycosyltransferase [Bacillus sp. V3B]|uniref:glycosyltransferase n=1 Tax=Bacillus sp. V3B TaxID=2804915 RepID=UPI00210EBC6E|nr:glycosyltransferase [Bacillus sp. V3B]MCQ6276844.1 glycosyltransferase [Bacillus sp. V3B]
MQKDDYLLVLGMFPWNYSHLSDTIRSMIKASNHKRTIYINPQAEIRSVSTKWEKRQEGNIHIWNPPFQFLPTRYGIHRLREKMTAYSLADYIKKELGEDWRNHTVMYVTPTTLEQSFEYVKKLKPKRLIVDLLDDNLNFPSISMKKKSKLTEMLKFLCQQATVITAVSQYLVEQAKEMTDLHTIQYLPNGVDVEMFQKKESLAPEDLELIPKPRITFVGALTTWIDFPLILEVARKLEDYQFILIGPMDQTIQNNPEIKQLKLMENVHFLGPKPYEQIPNYLHDSDVLLLPRTMDPYSLACDPLKLYEYLATGKPVVSTNHPSTKRFPDFVYTGGSSEEMAEGIKEALTRSTKTSQLQQKFSSSLSWETRIHTLLDLVDRP